MVELKNDYISIRVSEKGAELQSIQDNKGKEYLWQADPMFWPRHSPILFPIVCSVNNETYRVDGKEYHLVIWHVRNDDTHEIHFQIGGHPAFNIPGMKAGDNQSGRIRLDNTELMDALHSYGDGSHDMDEVPFVEAENGLMEFSDNTWRNDSIKIHKSQLHRAELLGTDGEPEVTVDFRTPVVAFWSPYGKQAPFVCIEPWYGIGDPRGFSGEFKDKPLMNHLQPGASFMSKYEITIRKDL